MTPLRDHAVGEPGAHAHGDPPRGGGRREGGLRQVGRRLRRHRPGDGDGPLRAQGRRRRGGRPAGAPAGGRGSRLRAALRAHAEAGAAGARRRRRGVSARPHGSAADVARRARSLLQALDLGAVRPHGDGGHGAAARRRCRRGARPRHEQGSRAHRRLHAPLLRRRPGLGRGAGGGGGLAQPHRRGRPAIGYHRLPQLRQSRAAAGHGPVRGLHRGHGRCLPGTGLPGGLGQRLLLQRDRGSRHPAHAVGRRARPDRRPGSHVHTRSQGAG